MNGKWLNIRVLMFCVLLGLGSGIVMGESGKEEKNCGGSPPHGTGEPWTFIRSDNANCEDCYKDLTCKLADKKFKVCQDKGTGCVTKPLPDLIKCDGEHYTKPKCKGDPIGPCQDNRTHC